MKLFFLSKEDIRLAKAEVEAILTKGKLIENVLLVNTKKTTDRLAYTNFLGEVVLEFKKVEDINKFDWNKIVKGSFAVEVLIDREKSESLSRQFGGMVYDKLKSPKVNLEKPKTKLIFIKIKNRYYVVKEEWRNKEKFSKRLEKRAVNQPITLKPKLARACVNLTGSKTSIYDPFCGIGGLLIEAELMGLKIEGSDNNKWMVDKCKKNLKKSKSKIFEKDALEIKKKYDYIITDLPYGKNTKRFDKSLYKNFLSVLHKILKKRAVVMFPDFINAKPLLKKFKIKGEHTYYLHKSLSKKIFVLEK